MAGRMGCARFQINQRDRILTETLPDTDQVVQLSSNIDDATAEALGYVMDLLLDAGALDVWFTAIHMKKNRPATQLNVLANLEDADRMAMLLLRETPTLGVRKQLLSRYKCARQFRKVATPWGPVTVKLKILQGEVLAASPEYYDCARLAAKVGVPLEDVMAAAQATAQAQEADALTSELEN